MTNDGSLWAADSVQIWLYNGNGRAEKLLRSWEESEFQTTLAAQHSRDYEMKIEQYAAALGARGDYFLVKVPVSHTDLGAAGTDTTVNGHLFIDFEDILGVPADVQLAKKHGYAKHSPFDSPDIKVTDEMKVGVEAERLALVLNKTVTGTSYVSQYIHGEADARLQAKWVVAPAAADDTDHVFWLRLKPTATNVFLLRYDSRIWVLPANTATTKGFFEYANTA